MASPRCHRARSAVQTHPSLPRPPNVSAHATFGTQSRPFLQANQLPGLATQSMIVTTSPKQPQKIQILDGGISISTLLESTIESEDDYPDSDAESESESESFDLVSVASSIPDSSSDEESTIQPRASPVTDAYPRCPKPLPVSPISPKEKARRRRNAYFSRRRSEKRVEAAFARRYSKTFEYKPPNSA
ncbi:hypothetical protein BDN72DRAFT_903448, partial [Pluteus cervinus]